MEWLIRERLRMVNTGKPLMQKNHSLTLVWRRVEIECGAHA